MNLPAFLAPALLVACLVATPGWTAEPVPLFDETTAETIFAFDEVTIPFAQHLRLEMRQPERLSENPVLPRGAKGAVDAYGVQFYGSVIREGAKFRMWYVAAGEDRGPTEGPRSAPWRPAYAESDDGLHWNKPSLGLLEYRGSKDNNLVSLDAAPLGVLNLKVLRDATDPDPERRYKMTAHVWFSKGKSRLGTLAVFASPDGLRWKSLTGVHPVEAELTSKDLLLPELHYEPCGGLYQWGGLYYISGQNAINAPTPYHGRVARTFVSTDFTHWLPASAIAFVREPQHTILGPGRSLEGEQQHEGLSVWNRRNVLLGVFGQWHGAKEWKDITIDLGFALSNDGLHFREPKREWTFLQRGADGAWDQGGVMQGQGFENIGAQTFVYYGAWDPRRSGPRGGVGIATLPRDRFGDLVVEEVAHGPGDYQLPEPVHEFVTAPLASASGLGQRFFLNADGLGPQAALKVELLGADLQPLPGYAGKNAAMIRTSGFQTPIAWQGITFVQGGSDGVRCRVTFEGEKKTGIRFSALYRVGAQF